MQVTAQHSTSHHFPKTRPVDDYYNMLLIPQLGLLSALYQHGLCHFLILISKLLLSADYCLCYWWWYFGVHKVIVIWLEEGPLVLCFPIPEKVSLSRYLYLYIRDTFFHNDGINFTAHVESIANDVYMTLLESIFDC